MMKLNKHILSCLLVVTLVFCMMPMTAFAYADEEATTEPSAEPTEVVEITDEGDEAAEEEPPFTYDISEDGSIVIIIGGQKFTLNTENTEEITKTGTVSTNGGRLNLRTGAGMEYEVIDQLRHGEEVTVIGQEGEWYKVIVPEKTGYVHSSYLDVVEHIKESGSVDFDSDMLTLILNMFSQAFGKGEADPQAPFTPDGNLTLIDDILQIEAYPTEDTDLKEKQFVTLQSKSGNTFYLVIDRTGNTENAYFMNLVDEADLMTLIEDGENGKTAPVCNCTDKCAVGAINTNCEICRTNMSECVGVEPKPVEEPTEPTEPVVEEPEETGNPLMVVLLLAILGGGGAFAYIKFFKNKPKTKGGANLDDYDYGDEDDDAMDAEWEIEDSTDDSETGEDSSI